MTITDAANICRACPSRCESACPAVVGSHRIDWTPRAMMLAAAADPASPASLHCTGCGNCTAACDVDVPVAALLRARRGPAARAAGLARAEGRAMAAAWQAVAPHPARQVFVARCGCGAAGVDAEALNAALVASGRGGWRVVEGLDCGRRLREAGNEVAFAAMSGVVADALEAVRTLIVPGGACAEAFEEHGARGGLVAFYVATLDGWLARYGVALPRGAAVLERCGLGRGAARGPSPASAAWPPQPVCCGGRGPLADVAPEAAIAAGAALLGAYETIGVRALHVEDATCAAHLRAVARQTGSGVAIVDRATTWLAERGGER